MAPLRRRLSFTIKKSSTRSLLDHQMREEHIPVSDGPHEDNPLNVFAASQAQEHRHSSPTPSAAPQVDFRDAADGSVESPPSIQSTVEGDSSSDSVSILEKFCILPDEPNTD
ncbi:hypothetical protein EYZ11_007737 [Aspergillus tanneri]|uniref:Uncharacterized protein n=1 Tax=Aspergillus tanneri TaxID=1220188 RepID=A0A4S3JC81_9EURO|nr:hypothetical protein EYZ11_007737 [Aspergillus tanneri]